MSELRRLAEAATPGPWHSWNRGIGWEVHTHLDDKGEGWCPSLMDWDSLGKGVFTEPMAAYIAAASPDRILALLQERDAAVSARQEAERRLATLLRATLARTREPAGEGTAWR